MFDRPLPPSRRYREQQREYREAQRQKRQQRLDALHDDRGRKRARPGSTEPDDDDDGRRPSRPPALRPGRAKASFAATDLAAAPLAVELIEPLRSQWNAARGAYDVALPHGSTWSSRQIEWFVGLWWKNLANASVAAFSGSLAQFSLWAADDHGLECLTAWLPKVADLREDVLTVQARPPAPRSPGPDPPRRNVPLPRLTPPPSSASGARAARVCRAPRDAADHAAHRAGAAAAAPPPDERCPHTHLYLSAHTVPSSSPCCR